MRKILLDTNFLIYCAENKIDYKDQIQEKLGLTYQLIVPTIVVIELKKIAENAYKYSDRNAAKLALQMLDFNKILREKFVGRSADQVLLKNSQGNIIATVDLALRNRVESSLSVGGDKRIRLS